MFNIATVCDPRHLRSISLERFLDQIDLDLVHRQHCPGGALGGVAVGGCDHLAESRWRHLPGHAEAILAPATPSGAAAVCREEVSIAIDLRLVGTFDLARHGPGERELGAAVDACQRAPGEREFNHDYLALGRRRIIGR
jgi:hypothetical protein